MYCASNWLPSPVRPQCARQYAHSLRSSAPQTCEAVRPPVRRSSAPLVPEVKVALAGKSLAQCAPPVRPLSWK